MLIDMQSIKALGRQLGKALSDDHAVALAMALEEADMTRRLRKAANAGSNRRYKRLTSIRKRCEKLVAALSVDDDARADLDILTPPGALSCDTLASQLRRVAATANTRAEQVRSVDGAAGTRARDEAIEDLAAIAERHLGLDPKTPNPAQQALFTDFVRATFRLWGLGAPPPHCIPAALGLHHPGS